MNSTNLEPLSKFLVQDARNRSGCFRANDYGQFMWLWGGDFNFQNATLRFDNMDKIVDYINIHSKELKATARYATVAEYLEICTNIPKSLHHVDTLMEFTMQT